MAAITLRSYLRWLGIAVLLLGAGGIAAVSWQLPPMLWVGSSYIAKTVCSGMYVSGLDLNRIWAEDVLGRKNPLLNLYKVTVDDPAKRITASPFGFGMFERTAVHRDGLGCALAIGVTPSDLAAESGPVAAPGIASSDPWPRGSAAPGATPPALAKVLADAFVEPDGDNAGDLRTRAVVVVHRGRLVAERYADGITASTPLIGWSMSKTVTAALAGIAMARTDLDLDIDHLLPQWQSDSNPKSRIPFASLLEMTDGLDYNEDYGTVTDTTEMLYGAGNAIDYLAGMDLKSEPGSVWAYSSGANMLVMGTMRTFLPVDSWTSFPRTALFGPIGMTSAVFETDPSGTFMGPSWLNATARDWARFGLLIQQKGLWDGDQVLPVGWVDTMMEPVAASNGQYSKGDIWLETGSRVPPDTLWVLGHDGQTIAIVPSLELIVVRMGMTNPQELYDREALLADVIAALPAN
jgi:CubicO group peptidase (beta-lactamase class C family)